MGMCTKARDFSEVCSRFFAVILSYFKKNRQNTAGKEPLLCALYIFQTSPKKVQKNLRRKLVYMFFCEDFLSYFY